MIFGLRIATQMAGRLRQLQNAVDVVAEGNYEAKVPIASRDEIGRLSMAFNTMATALKVSRSELVEYGRRLEERVASRTEDLTQANERLNYLAQYDSLTGLPNRSLFQDRLEHTLALAKRNDRPAALLFIDLDRFKIINDTRVTQSATSCCNR